MAASTTPTATSVSTTGVTSIGGTLSYAIPTTPGVVPTTAGSFVELARIAELPELNEEASQVDLTAIKDSSKRYGLGRTDNGGSYSVTVLVSNDTIAQWEAVQTDQDDGNGGERDLCFQITLPDMTKSWFIFGRVPQKLSIPNITNGDDAVQINVPIIVSKNHGLDTKVEPTSTDNS